MFRFVRIVAVASMFVTSLTSLTALTGFAGLAGSPAVAATGSVPPGCTVTSTYLSCKNVLYDGVHRLDAYLPNPQVTGEPVIIVIHGSGWRAGNKSQLASEARYFAANGFAAVSIDYTLSTPTQPSWPQAFVDVEAAYDWVTAGAQESTYGWDGSRVASFGTSAGGHLAAVLYANGAHDGHPVTTTVAWSGAMDLPLTYQDGALDTQAAVQQLLGCVPGSCPGTPGADIVASPDRNVTPDDPPILFFHSTDDPIVSVTGARAMNRALAAAQVRHTYLELPGEAHAASIRCLPATVGGLTLTVAQQTARWFGRYLAKRTITPTPYPGC